MYINQEKCVGCKRCLPYCPVEAISIVNNKANIDLDKCLECGVCERLANCPRDAIYNVELEPPRAYRKAFSDPFGKHKNTTLQHMGRGTEEVKTNDVTGVVHDQDHVTFAIELGRPSVGASFKDLQKVLFAVIPFVETFEVNNPVTSLIQDKKTGELDPTVLNERVMSAIIEFSCKVENAEDVIAALQEVANDIDTVFSTCIVARVDEETDTLRLDDILEDFNIDLTKYSAKTNMGLGRPRYEERIKKGE